VSAVGNIGISVSQSRRGHPWKWRQSRSGDLLFSVHPALLNCRFSASCFAPAFTSLGIFYSEATNPPDPLRASKCFQKNFELNAREVDAARRVAEGLAEEREWILSVLWRIALLKVKRDLNSQEVIDGRYLPVNVWAWKASGVVRVHLVIFSSLLTHPSGLTARAEQR
jgi:hypothetical protein